MIPIPEQLILETDKVILKPLSDTDYDEMLRLAGLDPDMWYYFSLNLSDPAQLTHWFKLAATAVQICRSVILPIARMDKYSCLIHSSGIPLALPNSALWRTLTPRSVEMSAPTESGRQPSGEKMGCLLWVVSPMRRHGLTASGIQLG